MSCAHLDAVAKGRKQPAQPSAQGCEDCLRDGSRWVHLRLCLTCGHVGCCDSSPNRHATKHHERTKHPVIKSFEPGEDWAWCFVHEEAVDAIPPLPGESPARHYG